MRENHASRTAQYAAGFRALEDGRRPASARLFDDPFAVEFLSPELRRVVRLAAMPLVGPLVRAVIDRRWPGAMTSGIARTRLIDDLLRASVGAGCRRVLLLGAGFDCRAWRLPELTGCRLVEVDHPATQAAKRDRLARLNRTAFADLSFVAADLTREDLRQVLQAAGLGPDERAFVLWEGVTHYLGEAAVDRTLRILAAELAAGSRVLFTYLHGGLLDGSMSFDGASRSMTQVAGDGEPWIWGMDPARLSAFLAERGWRLLEDHGANDYRARYWGERGRRMRGFAFYRVALAEIVGQASGR